MAQAIFRVAFLSFALSTLARAFDFQVPFSTHPGEEEWRLDTLPNPNATDHLVFETVHSLLQHWPNTRMRNGHSIVPGIIPEGTILFHGSDAQDIPHGPEWYALNVEHSHFFCRKTILVKAEIEGCWLFTFVTTRPLKVVYFDGSSAAKLPWGTMDTQDYFAWGETRPQDMWLELIRARDLCKWAERNGVDGFVRMEMSFEIVACDFASGVNLLSSVHIPAPLTKRPIWSRPMIEVLTAGSLQNRFPGETRIQLDLAGLVSFYDTELAPSLVPLRVNQERWDHRVQNVSSQDWSAAMARLEAAVARPVGQSSGIEWATLIHGLMDRYAGRLAVMRHLLSSPVSTAEHLLDLADKVQTQLRIMLTPYVLLSATPMDVDWVTPIYKLCATTHMGGLNAVRDAMTDSEKLLLRAVRGTNREICRVVTRMWTAGVDAGMDPLLNTHQPVATDVERVWRAWGEDINLLMNWLDWSVWVKCEPECGPEELCYLPTWPLDFPHFPKPGMGDQPWWGASMPDSDAWARPQPTCISRTQRLPW